MQIFVLKIRPLRSGIDFSGAAVIIQYCHNHNLLQVLKQSMHGYSLEQYVAPVQYMACCTHAGNNYRIAGIFRGDTLSWIDRYNWKGFRGIAGMRY